MSSLELSLSLLVGSVSGVGTWYWVKTHSHPDLVPRPEFDLWKDQLSTNYEHILDELKYLRHRLDEAQD